MLKMALALLPLVFVVACSSSSSGGGGTTPGGGGNGPGTSPVAKPGAFAGACLFDAQAEDDGHNFKICEEVYSAKNPISAEDVKNYCQRGNKQFVQSCPGAVLLSCQISSETEVIVVKVYDGAERRNNWVKICTDNNGKVL